MPVSHARRPASATREKIAQEVIGDMSLLMDMVHREVLVLMQDAIERTASFCATQCVKHVLQAHIDINKRLSEKEMEEKKGSAKAFLATSLNCLSAQKKDVACANTMRFLTPRAGCDQVFPVKANDESYTPKSPQVAHTPRTVMRSSTTPRESRTPRGEPLLSSARDHTVATTSPSFNWGANDLIEDDIDVMQYPDDREAGDAVSEAKEGEKLVDELTQNARAPADDRQVDALPDPSVSRIGTNSEERTTIASHSDTLDKENQLHESTATTEKIDLFDSKQDSKPSGEARQTDQLDATVTHSAAELASSSATHSIGPLAISSEEDTFESQSEVQLDSVMLDAAVRCCAPQERFIREPIYTPVIFRITSEANRNATTQHEV